MVIREGLEARCMKIRMIVAIVKGLVLVQEVMTGIINTVMMKEEVLDMSKKIEHIVITREVVLLVLKSSMIGEGMIGLEMVGKMKIGGHLMEI